MTSAVLDGRVVVDDGERRMWVLHEAHVPGCMRPSWKADLQRRSLRGT